MMSSCFLSVAVFCPQVDRHLRKLDQELAKFKMELEADNAGITEILERRGSMVVMSLTHLLLYLSFICCVFIRVFGDGQPLSARQQPSRSLTHQH